MRRPRKRSFSELVQENKQALLKDEQLLEKLEEKLQQKHLKKAE
ncbi:MAG TPA: FbpB family small basic protein [Bacillus sp. (in: firmicutes)]|nr:FbpB family small basic protein [Bacillus litorisediminis]HWO75304.1 FbpB family small basic protein [Bacillus sp. (in: firmicutes)]